MKVSICKTRKEANRYAKTGEKVVPYGNVFAIVPEKEYLTFLSTIADTYTSAYYSHK